MKNQEVKHGQIVTLNGQDVEWTVLDRSPAPAHWWLHRWSSGQWLTTEAHGRFMDLVSDWRG